MPTEILWCCEYGPKIPGSVAFSVCGRWSVCYPLCSKPTKTDGALRLSAACSAMHGRVLHLSRQFRILCCNIYDYDSKHEALPFLRHSSSVDQQQQQQREPQQQLEREKKKAEEFLVSSLPSYMTQHFVRNIIPKRANPNVQCVCVCVCDSWMRWYGKWRSIQRTISDEVLWLSCKRNK